MTVENPRGIDRRSQGFPRWADDARLSALLDRAAHGDQEAFMQFYDATCDLVWRLEMRRHRNSTVAAEAMCARFDVAARRAAEHGGTGLSARAWLLSIHVPWSPSQSRHLLVEAS